MVDGASIGAIEVERDGSTPALGSRRAVDSDEWLSVPMAKGREPFESRLSEFAHALVDDVEADRVEVLQSDLNGGQREVVGRAVLERRRPFRQVVLVPLHRRDRDRAA